MPLNATDYFRFIDSVDQLRIEKHELSDANFGTFRKGVRDISFGLNELEDDHSRAMSNRLMVLLLDLLTSPRLFDEELQAELVNSLGNVAEFQNRYGADLAGSYELALDACKLMSQTENPMRLELRELLSQRLNNGKRIGVYCHKTNIKLYESILSDLPSSSLGELKFLSSISDYRSASVFDELVKVGPLRSRGWGKMPNFVVTSPKYHRLSQLVWAGCSDDSDFGYDPVVSLNNSVSNTKTGSKNECFISTGWSVSIYSKVFSDSFKGEIVAEEDDLNTMIVRKAQHHLVRAVLVQHGSKGIFFRKNTRVIAFDNNAPLDNCVSRNLVSETLKEGMYLIQPTIIDLDLGQTKAAHGEKSRVWKKRLDEIWRKDSARLVSRLRNEGLDLIHLFDCVDRWRAEPSSVIHSPQTYEHFKILIKNIGLDNGNFCRSAWQEVRISRGKAINSGVQESEIVEEEVIKIIVENYAETKNHVAVGSEMPIPSEYGISGTIRFDLIEVIEDGFMVPETILREPKALSEVNQWRD